MEAGSISGGWVLQRAGGRSGRVGVWGRTPSAPPLPPSAPANLVIKICRFPKDGLTDVQRQSWRDHLTLLPKIKHANIVKSLDIPSDLAAGLALYNPSGLPVVCMEYCNMGDLRQLLDRPENSNGLCESDVRCVLGDLKNAVGYLHSLNVTHRNLKPENVILQPSESSTGLSFTCKLTDFECAQRQDSTPANSSSIGSLQYSAPELMFTKSCSKALDYWSLGIIAFEIICGMRPFLPNMSSVQWIGHAKSKTYKNICIFESLDDKIEYSDEIFEENRISRCFKTLIEKWLRSALQWDPIKRGSFENDESEQNLQTDQSNFFEYLDEVLSKKILTIFSVPTYECLSYEIDESTLFTTLQGWIERDTKISLEKQVILSETDRRVDIISFACDYWNQQLPVMLYLYQKNKTLDEEIKPRLSNKIQKYLETPKMNLNYNNLSRAYVDVYDFISKETLLYESLMQALFVKLRHIKNEINTLNKYHSEADKDISCRLSEKFNLLSEIIACDETRIGNKKYCKKLDSCIESWLDGVKPVRDNSVKLTEAWSQLTARLESVSRRCNDAYDKDIHSKQNNSELLQLKHSAIQLVVAARKMSKEERSSPKACIDGFKLLYKSFRLRDSLLFSADSKRIMQKILDIETETQKMGTLILSAGKNANVLSKSISTSIISKQNSMWNIFEEMSLHQNDKVHTEDVEQKTEVKKSLTDFKIGQPVRNPVSLTTHEHNSTELVSLINDSQQLCSIAEDFISRSYKKHKLIQNELLTDFKFLEAETNVPT
ncbi:inhibitor of nuclear factor kappa B kinase subunit beta [Arctopsyche grandis]|uniref:inhibitor of nuclear factor kappa B kinase subunit beta n=1 Tax=Arctopsyche grandis TaxID=121162 RepID=UPI00406D79CC